MFLVSLGWSLNLLASIWIVLLFLRMAFTLVRAGAPASGSWWGRVIEAPVNWVRATFPTLYRRVDFAPWLTILILVLLNTFLFRALIYWGMLHR